MSQLHIAVYSQLDASVASYKRLPTREGISLVDSSAALGAISLKYGKMEKGGFLLLFLFTELDTILHIQIPCTVNSSAVLKLNKEWISLSGEAPP